MTASSPIIRSSDRTVREEARILARLGWTYLGVTGASHHRFEHPEYGEIGMAMTPRNPKWFRVNHRKAVAARMGLSLWQFEQLIAGKPMTKRPRKRRRVKTGPRRSAVQLAGAPAPDRQPPPSAPPEHTWACGQCRERFRPTQPNYARNVTSIEAHGVCSRCWDDRIYWQGRSAA